MAGVKKPESAVAVVERRIERQVERWWAQKDLAACTDMVTLAQSYADVGVMALAHLARRLESQRTPMATKDSIAMAIAPRLVAEVRGRIAGAGRRTELTNHAGGAVQELLTAYAVKTEH